MGLWKLLTMRIGGRRLMRWNEPIFFGMKVQNRVKSRLAILAAFLAVPTSVIAVCALTNTELPNVLFIPFVLGFPVIFLIILRNDDHGGTVTVREMEIQRQRISGAIPHMVTICEQKWPYEAIDQCLIVPREKSGKAFSVLAIFAEDTVELIGIPRRIDLQVLADYIEARDVPVRFGSTVPAIRRRKEVGAIPALIVTVVAVVAIFGVLLVVKPLGRKPKKAPEDAAGVAKGQMQLDDPAKDPLTKFSRRENLQMDVDKANTWHDSSASSSAHGRKASPASDDLPGASATPGPTPGSAFGGRPMNGARVGPRGPSTTSGSRFAATPSANTPPARPATTKPAPPPPVRSVKPRAESTIEAGPSRRTWTDKSGKYRIEATLVDVENGQVILRKADGEQVRVPLDRLSEADRQFAGSVQSDSLASFSQSSDDGPGDTAMAGGTEGWEFRTEGSAGQLLVGIRYRLGGWAGEKTVGPLEAVFDRHASADRQQAAIAREGFAVGAVNVDAKRFVNALQLVFMRVKSDGRLDPTDSYTTEWIGLPTGRPTQTLGGSGAPIIGIYGRHGAILNALGLVRGG